MNYSVSLYRRKLDIIQYIYLKHKEEKNLRDIVYIELSALWSWKVQAEIIKQILENQILELQKNRSLDF